MSNMDSARIVAELSDANPEAVFFDGMDSALIGVGRIAHLDPLPVYSKARMYLQLFADGLSRFEAEECFMSKFVGLWAGDKTPIILDDMPED